AEAALATAVEIVRRVVQAEQHGRLLHGVGLVAEVFLGQVFKPKLVLGGDFPDQVQVNLGGLGGALGQHVGRVRLGEFDQHVGVFRLHALARVKLDLHGAVGFGHHTASLEFSGVVKKGKHQ